MNSCFFRFGTLSYQYLTSRNPPVPGAPLDMNESDATQNVYATYGDYEFLRRVYRKYDPTRQVCGSKAIINLCINRVN